MLAGLRAASAFLAASRVRSLSKQALETLFAFTKFDCVDSVAAGVEDSAEIAVTVCSSPAVLLFFRPPRLLLSGGRGTSAGSGTLEAAFFVRLYFFAGACSTGGFLRGLPRFLLTGADGSTLSTSSSGASGVSGVTVGLKRRNSEGSGS